MNVIDVGEQGPMILEMPRSAIERRDVTPVKTAATFLLGKYSDEHTRKYLSIFIAGYHEDSRELWCISEVRDWVAALVAEVPFVLEVTTVETMQWLIACVADVEPTGETSFRSEASKNTLRKILAAQHALFSHFATSQSEYDRLGNAALKRFEQACTNGTRRRPNDAKQGRV